MSTIEELTERFNVLLDAKKVIDSELVKIGVNKDLLLGRRQGLLSELGDVDLETLDQKIEELKGELETTITSLEQGLIKLEGVL